MGKKENIYEIVTEPQSCMVEGEWEGQTKTVSNVISGKGETLRIFFKIVIRTRYTGAEFPSFLKCIPWLYYVWV